MAARFPRVHGVLRAVARRSAGRHRVSVVAVVVSHGEVLVVRHVFRDDGWALPGGWIHRREDPFRAVEREIHEEIDLVVTAGEVVHAEKQGEGSGGVSALTLAIRCVPLGPGRVPLRLSPELDAARWLTVEECAGVVTAFELTSIERAFRLLGGGPAVGRGPA